MDANQICDLLDSDLITFIHNIIVLLKIAVPVILVFLGMLDLAKGVISSKEEEIKKGQQTFIKRLIAGVLVFLVVTIVQLVMGLISKDDSSIWNCANQILNGTGGSKYVPTGVSGNENNDDSNENGEGPSQMPDSSHSSQSSSGTGPSQRPDSSHSSQSGGSSSQSSSGHSHSGSSGGNRADTTQGGGAD